MKLMRQKKRSLRMAKKKCKGGKGGSTKAFNSKKGVCNGNVDQGGKRPCHNCKGMHSCKDSYYFGRR